MSRWKTAKHLRMARRAEQVILYDVENGKCIKIDEKSYSIFQFIRDNRPTLYEMVESFKEYNICEDELVKFVEWLRNMRFIEEIDL